MLDEVTLRAQLQDAVDGALLVADKVAERMVSLAIDPYSVALARSYQDMRRQVRQIKTALKHETGGC